MKQDSLDRLQTIQQLQYEALATQDIEMLNVLESEKTQLIKLLTNLQEASDEQRHQFQHILKTQLDLEQLCSEVRDELGKQIKQVMERHKAVSAYKDIE